MATSAPPSPLPSSIRSVLAGLRWRIRAYIWAEGLTLGIVCVQGERHECEWGRG